MKSLRLMLVMVLLGICVGFLGSGFRLGVSGLSVFLKHIIDQAPSVQIKVAMSAFISVFLVFLSRKMVSYFSPEASGSGVQEVERIILHHGRDRWWRVIPVKFIGGIFSLSAGLVLGREGPTIQLGASTGSMLSDFFNLTARDKQRCIAAGAVAGLATAFNAPMAGIFFIFEEMRPSFKFSWIHIQSVTIVCIVAAMILHGVIGSAPSIQVQVFETPPVRSCGIFFFFGLMMGVMGWIFNVTLIAFLNFLGRLKPKIRSAYILLSAALIGVLAILVPDVVTGGYQLLEYVFNESLETSFLVMVLLVRWGLGLMSYGMGVPGGIFAPILALGGLCGSLFFSGLPQICQAAGIQPGMLAIAGMGGLFSAVVRAPLTSVMLIIEMTQDGSMVLPLLVSCLIAAIFMNWVGNPSIYSQLLARRGLE